MTWKTRLPVAVLGIGLMCLPAQALAASSLFKFSSGGITGLVTDAGGIPQMGASVLLFNRQAKLYQRVMTDDRGAFSFAGIMPDMYSIRVSLASYLPAIKNNILVQPGVESVLNVSLASLFSSIQVVYPVGGQRALMNDDWKWVLRTANATRPVLRLLEMDPAERRTSGVFSETRGLVRVSGGDGGRTSAFGNEADLGTTFAVATSLFGVNQLQFAGNLGYASQSGIPSAAFRTSFVRNVGSASPEISMTMRQLSLPAHVAAGLMSGEGSLPLMRMMSLNFEDRTALSEALTFHYGFSLDSVSFLDRLNYFSPFARLTYSLGNDGDVEFTYTSGNPRPDLGAAPVAPGDPGTELQRDMNALAFFPRVSLREGRARVQRGENLELGYSRSVGSRTYRLGAYRERVTNASLAMSTPDGLFNSADIFPDPFSGFSIFNAGNYQNSGYTASVTQNLGENFSAMLMYGSVGALIADRREMVSDSPDELRSMIHAGRRHAVTARGNARLPWSGTHLIASYQWTDHRTASRGHLYSTQATRAEAGLNIYVKQPIPSFFSLPWRMEATADLRNLLAQGYLPLNLADGRRILLVHTPRSFRGGLSFIF